MKVLSGILLGVFVLIAVAGCKREVHFQLPQNETLKLLVYSSGKPIKERELAPLSKEHQLLASWLAANREGWSPTVVTFVPSVYVTGKDFSINFLKTSAIINFREGQYIKDVNPKDYGFLLEDNRT